MKIKKTDSEINILAGNDTNLLVYYGCIIAIPVGLYLLLKVLSNMLGLLLGYSESVWGSLFGFIIFVLVWFGALIIYPLQNYVFTKNTRSITIVTKPIWMLWKLPNRHYLFQDLKAVVLSGNQTGIELKLAMKSKPVQNLGSKSYDEKGDDETSLSEVAELLSSMMEIPLQINIGSEKIIKYPINNENASVVPLNCTRCGGQLPLVTAGMQHVTCSYCNTSSVILWENKRPIKDGQENT
jgi:hypothetical protein